MNCFLHEKVRIIVVRNYFIASKLAINVKLVNEKVKPH